MTSSLNKKMTVKSCKPIFKNTYIVVPSNRHVHSSCLASSINVCHVRAMMSCIFSAVLLSSIFPLHLKTLFFQMRLLIQVAKRQWYSAIPYRSHKLMICPAPLDTPVLWSPAPNICGCPLLQPSHHLSVLSCGSMQKPVPFFGCKYVPLYAEQCLSFCVPSFQCVFNYFLSPLSSSNLTPFILFV